MMPFDYAKFMGPENDYPGENTRAKIYMWVGDNDVHAQFFEQAGRDASAAIASNGLAALKNKKESLKRRNIPKLWRIGMSNMETEWISFFGGKNLNKEKMTAGLQECIYEK